MATEQDFTLTGGNTEYDPENLVFTVSDGNVLEPRRVFFVPVVMNQFPRTPEPPP